MALFVCLFVFVSFLSRLNTAAIQVLHLKMREKNHLTRLDTSFFCLFFFVWFSPTVNEKENKEKGRINR